MGTTGGGLAAAVVALATLGPGTAEGQWYRPRDDRDRLRIQGVRAAESGVVRAEGAPARLGGPELACQVRCQRFDRL